MPAGRHHPRVRASPALAVLIALAALAPVAHASGSLASSGSASSATRITPPSTTTAQESAPSSTRSAAETGVVGFYYFRLRYLDPGQGRFVNRDPIGVWGDAGNLGNGYSFCGNDPVNRVDPWGLLTGVEEATAVALGPLAVLGAIGGAIVSAPFAYWAWEADAGADAAEAEAAASALRLKNFQAAQQALQPTSVALPLPETELEPEPEPAPKPRECEKEDDQTRSTLEIELNVETRHARVRVTLVNPGPMGTTPRPPTIVTTEQVVYGLPAWLRNLYLTTGLPEVLYGHGVGTMVQDAKFSKSGKNLVFTWSISGRDAAAAQRYQRDVRDLPPGSLGAYGPDNTCVSHVLAVAAAAGIVIPIGDQTVPEIARALGELFGR